MAALPVLVRANTLGIHFLWESTFSGPSLDFIDPLITPINKFLLIAMEIDRNKFLKALGVLALLRYSKDVYDVYHMAFEVNQCPEAGSMRDTELEQQLLKAYENPQLVDKDESRRVLAELEAILPDDDKCCGLFTGLDDPALPIFRDLGAGITAPRAVLMQIIHPYIAKGVLMHSNVLTNNYDRAEKTKRFTLGMLYGSKKEILSASRQVRSLHSRVKGEIGEDIGIFNSRSPYDASQRDALIWVAATMPDSIRVGYEMTNRKLSPEEKEAVIQVNRKFMMCFGVEAPYTNWREYERYFATIIHSDKILKPSEACYDLYTGLAYSNNIVSKTVNNHIIWLSMVMCPQRVCEGFYGRTMNRLDYLWFAITMARIRFAFRLLPTWLRYLPQYHFMVRRVAKSELSWFGDQMVDAIEAFTNWAMKTFLTERPLEDVELSLEQARKERNDAVKQ